jgi:GT2 family glycosyltransferase
MISICISCWNRLEYLKKCIYSILSQDINHDLIELIIVDNCSSDGTQEYLQSLMFNFEYHYKIMDHSDYSAMQTLNIAFKMAKGDYILVLDDDVELIQRNSISGLLSVMSHSIGIVAANVITPQESLTQLEFKYPMDQIIDIRNLPKESFRVYDFIGACALIHRNCFKSIGYYDESFDIYWNEADTALKMLYSGYDVVYVPWITPVHYISLQSRRVSRGWYYFVRNGNTIINRFLPLRSRIILVPMRSAILLIQGLIWFKDVKLICKTFLSCLSSVVNIFYMKDRVFDAEDAGNFVSKEITNAYSAFHWRKFYEWLFRS